MKTIGILGGMGPLATIDFLGKLSKAAGTECPRILMDLDPTIPSRTLAILGKGIDPGPRILAGIRDLRCRGAEVIAVPCNSAYCWYPRGIAGAGWLNMPRAVSQALRCYPRVIILGGLATVSRFLYSDYLSDAQYLSPDDNESIYKLIADIKLMPAPSTGMAARLAQIIGKYRDSCDAFLLACTELSMIWPTNERGECLSFAGTPVVDSSWEYAKAVIAKARED